MLLLQLLINGLQVGALYALTAVGFSLIFGSTKVFHFAHGATFTLAAYAFYWLFSVKAMPFVVGLLGAGAVAIAFGLIMDRWVYAPIQKHRGSFFTVFVASFGMAIVVQNLVGMIFGRSFVTISTPLSRSIPMGDLLVSPLAGVAIICALSLLALLHWFLMRTHAGMALRALADNAELVRTYGLSPRKLSAMVFCVGSLLAVPAAIIGGASSGLSPSIGNHVMLISLAATVVGGIGSIRGAACAGLLLGLAESLALWKLEPQWSEAVTFVVLILFILFRPSGFFGRPINA